MAKPLVKICGIKSVNEARAVLEVGAKFSSGGSNLTGALNLSDELNLADSSNLARSPNVINFIGVIFAPSKRRVEPEIARQIAALAHEYGVKCVGVFGGQTSDQVAEICKFAGLDAVQLHGSFELDLRALLAPLGVQIWQAYSVADTLPEVDFSLCDMPLFDCKGANLGGNGVSFDWGILRGVKFKFGLAGGIDENNVCEAAKFKPYLIDANSRLEDENLIKIPSKIEHLLRNLSD